MKGQKHSEKMFSTCLKGSSCAVIRQKMMRKQEIGPLCQEMMKFMLKGFSEIKLEP